MSLIVANKISFAWTPGRSDSAILTDVSFKIEAGEFIGVEGPSGSGKSTLFYTLGGLLNPTSGEILVNGVDITKLSDLDLAWFRSRTVGFVFQQFHLMPRANVLENILIPAGYPAEFPIRNDQLRTRAAHLAERLGLTPYLSQEPHQLSGGQQQRVAIARALLHDPPLILADEPTGNLDTKNAAVVLELFHELNREGKTIILITHDRDVAAQCQRTLTVRDGRVTEHKLNTRPVSDELVPAVPREPAEPSVIAAIRRCLPLAFENLWRNKVKSGLTMLGVVIGVSAVFSMITTGEYTKHRILEGYESLGVNKILLGGYSLSDSGRGRRKSKSATKTTKVKTEKGTATIVTKTAAAANRLNTPPRFYSFNVQRDLDPLKKIFPSVTRFSPTLNSWQSSLIYGGVTYSDNVQVLGVNHDYMAILRHEISQGRALTPFNISNRDPVCVVGSEIPINLNIDDPIGTIITVSFSEQASTPCKIVGVMAPQSSNISWYQPNRVALLPYTYYKSVFSSWASEINQVVINIGLDYDVELASKELRGFFEQKFGGTGEFWVNTDSTLIAQMKRFLTIFSLLLTGIAMLALGVGGIGIHNMMIVSVAERLKEIGLRKALGATHQSIKMQVLLESVLLCGVGGIVGLTVGFATCAAMMFAATKFVPSLKFEWVFNPFALTISTVAIVAVGILSGLVPARRAEKLQVIEALRAE